MQRLGIVLNVTPSHSIIVKITKIPKLGSTVVDENLKVIGKIFDIIGPTASPYAVVKPSVKEPEKFIEKQLYALLSKKERSRKE